MDKIYGITVQNKDNYTKTAKHNLIKQGEKDARLKTYPKFETTLPHLGTKIEIEKTGLHSACKTIKKPYGVIIKAHTDGLISRIREIIDEKGAFDTACEIFDRTKKMWTAI